METQETPAPSANYLNSKYEDLNSRVRKLFGQAQSQFRETGLEYSHKLYRYFEEMSTEAAQPGAPGDAVETPADDKLS